MKKNAILLGVGSLNWDGMERRSDRYGMVSLFKENSEDKIIEPNTKIEEQAIKAHVGQKGKLVVKITATRESTHIGDIFRGLSPSTPKVGKVFTLGDGTLFSRTDINGQIHVGLQPDDDRQSDWLNARTLYKVHEQSVELYFEPSAN